MDPQDRSGLPRPGRSPEASASSSESPDLPAPGLPSSGPSEQDADRGTDRTAEGPYDASGRGGAGGDDPPEEPGPQLPTGSPPPPEDPSRLLSRADLAFSITLMVVLVLTLLLYAYFPLIMAVSLVSAVVTYALVPVADILEKQGLNRTVGVLLAGLAVAGIVTLVVVLMAPAVSAQLQELPEAISRMAERLGELWEDLRSSLPDVVITTSEGIVSGVWDELSGFEGMGGGQIARYAGTAASGVTAVAVTLVLVPVFTFLMLRRYHQFTGGMMSLVPYRWRPRFAQRAGEVDVVLSGFIRGQLTICAILVVLYGIAFSIIGIPLALLVAILGGIAELIPYLGNAIAVGFGVLLALASGSTSDAIWVVVVYFAIQGLQSAFITPYIMGRRVSLSPVTIIVALAIGGQVLGFMGLLLAVPAAALLKVSARSALSAWRLSGYYRRSPT